MSGTSSASPEDLQIFVKSAGDATDRLEQSISAAAGTVNAFYDAPCDPRFRPAGSEAAFGQASTLVADDRTDERWIAGIRQAFLTADTNTLPDASIAASLSAQGISPTAPGQLTVDEPVYQGAVMYSGWTDDPVSTGTGHFLERDQDLAMPDALAVLGWTRTYSSRFVADQCNGRGWHTWADVRLDVQAAIVTYHGPDGQVSPFARAGDDWVRHPAMEAELRDAEGGFELAWRWTARFPGLRWKFDEGGRLQRMVDPFGGETAVERDGDRLVALVHDGGRRLDVVWSNGLVSELVSSDGRRVFFQYDAGRLTGVDRPGGAIRYRYGGDGRLLDVTDADGVRLVHNEYDSEGRVVAQTSPHGRVARLRYVAPSTVIVTDDASGPATLFRHDSSGRLVELQLADGSRSTRRFDVAGNPVEVVAFDRTVIRREFDRRGDCVREERTGGAVRRWGHDSRGRLVGLVDELGREYVLEYAGDSPLPARISGPLGCVTSLEVRDGLVVGVTDADGVSTRFQYDAARQVVASIDGTGATTRFAYHRSGQLESVELPTGEVTRWTYDGGDRAVVTVAADGARFEREFTPAGRLLGERGPTGETSRLRWGPHGDVIAATDANGGTVELARDVNGWLTEVRDAAGATWSNTWDELGRLHSTADPLGNRWGVRWDPPDRLAAVVDPLGHARSFELGIDGGGQELTVTSAAGRTYQLRWDHGGRFAIGTTPEGPSWCELRHDDAGRPVEWLVDGQPVARLTYTAAGRLASLSRPDGCLWRWRYDPAGRPTELVGPEGVEEVVYDAVGRPLRLRLVGGELTRLDWGAAGRLRRVVVGDRAEQRRYDGWGLLTESVSPLGARWGWERDGLGRVRQVTDPLGASLVLRRDKRGAIVAAVGPDAREWRYERDAAGRVIALIDPLGRRTGYRWDGVSRIEMVQMPDGSQRLFRWDPDGSTLGVDAIDGDGEVAVLLEAEHDWPARAVTLRGSGGRELRMRWDGQGRMISCDSGSGPVRVDPDHPAGVVVERPAGTTIIMQLSSRGWPVQVNHPAIGEVSIKRDGAGRLLLVEAAGIRREWRRDANGDTVEYRQERAGQVVHTVLQRDGAGRVIAAVEDGVRRAYRYDAAGQLLAAEGPEGAWEWSYDPAGRLLTERSGAGIRSFSYDAADQLRSVTNQGGRTTVRHDPLGRRVAETGPAGEVRYGWDQSDRLVAIERSAGAGWSRTELEYDPLGRLVRVGDVAIEWDGVEPLGQCPSRIGETELIELYGVPIAEVAGGEATWLSADWRGSVGPRLAWGAAPGAGRQAHPEVGFLGEIEVEGLVWLRTRWYDPSTHTFLSRDPHAGSLVAVGGGTNPYLYAHNDPVQWVDPLGLHPITAAEAAQQMQAWPHGHWQQLAVTVAAVAAIAVVTMVAPEADALILPMVLGGAGGAGGTVVGDLWNGRPIDWSQVVMDGALGAALGTGGATIGGVGGIVENPLSGLAARGVNVLYGTTTSGGFTAVDRWATGAPFSVKDELISGGFGLTAGLAPHVNEDITWADKTSLSDAQVARYNLGQRDANFYVPRVQAAQNLASKAVAAARSTNLHRDLMFGSMGAVAGGVATTGTADAVPPGSTYYPPVAKPARPAIL